jgi:hypothetical protein
MADVFVYETMPGDVFAVRVGDNIVATMREADEGVMAWYPAESSEPEYVNMEDLRARCDALGTFRGFFPLSDTED